MSVPTPSPHDLHKPALRSSLYLPYGHNVHFEEAVFTVSYPRGHPIQVDAHPANGTYSPTKQSLQSARPRWSAYLPALHNKHDLPACPYEHNVHGDNFDSTYAPCLPAGQGVYWIWAIISSSSSGRHLVLSRLLC